MQPTGTNDLQDADHLLTLCFGSLKPRLVYLPHCLFRQGTEALAIVLQVVRCQGGIFGDRPLRDREGRPYVGFGKEEFTLWSSQ